MISLGNILIFGIILVPVYVAILAAFIGKPRQTKFTAFIYGSTLAMIVMAILGIWVLGKVLSLFIPH